MAIVGYVTKEQAEDVASVAGVEFDEARDTGYLYIDEGYGAQGIDLTLDDLYNLKEQVQQVINTMRWHYAKWMCVGFGGHMAATHFALKGAEKTLCGRKIEERTSCFPLLKEPMREKRTTFSGGTCQRCMSAYDKQNQPKAS